MMAKHNKKRNTAFIFEALSQEMTRAIVDKDEERKREITIIVTEFFKRGKEVRKELDLYRHLNESTEEDRSIAIRILQEVKKDYDNLNREKLFKEQTALINRINKKLSKSVFSNFVGNYKHLATIAQIFDRGSQPKNRILMENVVIDAMTKEAPSQEMRSVDNVVYKSFVEKFNEAYSTTLPDDQKMLLGKFVSSFADNGVEFKIYMNEEIGRLKERVKKSLEQEEIASDEEMKKSTTEVYKLLERTAEKPIDEDLVRKVLSVQDFIREVES